MEVIDATAGHFAIESMKVIPKWRWRNLSDDVITSPVTRRTRFEFCLILDDSKTWLRLLSSQYFKLLLNNISTLVYWL